MVFKKISFAQANWDKDINSNYEKTAELQDSDWQHLTILAPATGILVVRLYNGVLFFAGAVAPNATGDVPVATGLLDSGASFPVADMNNGDVISARVDSATRNIIIKGITSVNSNHQFSFDGNNIFVGPWTQLGGGREPLLNHWFKWVCRFLEKEAA